MTRWTKRRAAGWAPVLLLAVAACADGAPSSVEPERVDVPAAMGAALLHAATVDNTFGGGFRFATHFVLSSTDPHAGGNFEQAGSRPLTDGERAGIETALAPLGDVRWIADASAARTGDLQPIVPDSVILAVGDPTVEDLSVLVPVSLWCSGACGLWITYRVDRIDGVWQVTGTEGPATIS